MRRAPAPSRLPGPRGQLVWLCPKEAAPVFGADFTKKGDPYKSVFSPHSRNGRDVIGGQVEPRGALRRDLPARPDDRYLAAFEAGGLRQRWQSLSNRKGC